MRKSLLILVRRTDLLATDAGGFKIMGMKRGRLRDYTWSRFVPLIAHFLVYRFFHKDIAVLAPI